MLKKNFKNTKQKTLKITLEIGDCIGDITIFIVRITQVAYIDVIEKL